MSVNKVILLGRLGKDPELRYTQNQTPVCSFSLATSERRKDQSGTWVDATEWHNVVAFGRTAENINSYLKKGREVFIDGSIRTRKWQDREGKDRYTTEIIANTVQFVGGRPAGEGAPSERGAGSYGQSSYGAAAVGSDYSAPMGGFNDDPLAGLSSADSVAGGGSNSFGDDDIPF